MITLPAVAATGATSVTGTMTFGIATQADNALGSATLYSLDPCGDFPTVTYDGIAYTDTFCNTERVAPLAVFSTRVRLASMFRMPARSASSGSPIVRPSTNGFGFYCVSPGPTATLSNIAILGNGVGSGTTSLNIYDATTLFNTNNAVFNDLGSDSGTNQSTDYFDFGAPFFIGRTVFIGIAGEAVPGGVNAPYGFVAF